MEIQGFTDERYLKVVQENYDFVVIGGGLTGVCCAITAARAGIKVALLQDRPVLGGNASSEVRLWALGATSHMGNNNRWSREGGVINEILVENVYRNKDGNPLMFDMLLIDKVLAEKNITLRLNTVVYDVVKSSSSCIEKVLAYNPACETKYEIKGTIFADCSGDGIVSYLSGVSFRMGAEDKEEFDEGFAPDKAQYGELMGHSIFFYIKDAGHPVSFVTPDFALQDVEACIPKIQNSEYFDIHHHGCKYWWLEYGGRLDTIHDTEAIKMELWKVVYGIWGYIKNSGKYPEMDNYTLEWAGLIPGKRESRRFKGLYTLTQQDIICQNRHYDAVAYGGWAIDLHPADGVYGAGRACNQWHSKGIYQIPFRCFVGAEIDNLMFGGRIASVTHVANGSTRVMCTSAHGGQAIGMAAALCIHNGLLPIAYADEMRIKELQRALIETGQYIPDIVVEDDTNLLNQAKLSVSSELELNSLLPNGNYVRLDFSVAQLLPVRGKMPEISLDVIADEDTELIVELRTSSKSGNYTPDVSMESYTFALKTGLQSISIPFVSEFAEERYVFVCFMRNLQIRVAESDQLLTGVMTVFNQVNIAVSNYGRQEPPVGIGVETFEFWCPKRRPDGKNLALNFSVPLKIYSVKNLLNSYFRPFKGTNAWAADWQDEAPTLILQWKEMKKISSMRLFFDANYDHAMETVQYGHYDRVMPQCVRKVVIRDMQDEVRYMLEDNFAGCLDIKWNRAWSTDKVVIELAHPSGFVPAAMFGLVIR